MNTNEKITLSIAASDAHAEAYDIAIPKRVRDFVSSGAAFEVDGRCWKDETGDTYRVRAIIPSWEAQCSFGPLDDAVVGPDGDWSDSGRYLPLFVIGESPRFFVVDLESAKCPVLLFEEEGFGANGDEYAPAAIAGSLEELVGKLVDVQKPTFETADQDLFWTMAAQAAADGDDDDD